MLLNGRLFTLVLISNFLLLPGCHVKQPLKVGSARSVSVLRYPITMEPQTLDPTLATTFATSELLQNIYEGLTRLDGKGLAVPCLADSWENGAGGSVYT